MKILFYSFFHLHFSIYKNIFLGGNMMKRLTALVILALLFVLMLTGCGKKYIYEQTELHGIVVQCEQGTFHRDAHYASLANMYLAQKNYGLWSMYLSLSNSHGTYDYNVTCEIEGDIHTVVRKNSYEIGAAITIYEVKTYDMDSQLVDTEYR